MRYEYQGAIGALHETIVQLADEERSAFVDRLTRLHCRQRSAQDGGDILFEFGGYWCPIWYDRAPENTPIQKQVFAWSRSDRSPTIAAFGADVVLAIREMIERSQEQKRRELIERRDAERERTEAVMHAKGEEIRRETRKLTPMQRWIAVPVATLARPQLRTAVAGNLASLLQNAPEKRTEVLERYRTENDPELKEVAAATSRALWLSQNTSRLAIILIIFFGVLWVAG